MGDLVENGIIESADISFERGFALTFMIGLRFEGSGQGFGGWVLGGNPFDKPDVVASRHDQQANIAADFIGGVMAVAGVERWRDLPGKVIRVKRESPYGSIVAIGHAIKDRWYCPEERLTTLRKAEGR